MDMRVYLLPVSSLHWRNCRTWCLVLPLKTFNLQALHSPLMGARKCWLLCHHGVKLDSCDEWDNAWERMPEPEVIV
eukprot:4284887-Amphidinium_carterae.1